jgi:uncharacterized protein YgiM (DUF1202 family)
MANCYKCGAYIQPNSGYKRRVKTGDSFGMSFGRRIVPSVRTYFGSRTLCANCASQHDNFEKLKAIFWIILLGGFVVYLITPSCKPGLNSKASYSSGNSMITAPSGHSPNINNNRHDATYSADLKNNTSNTNNATNKQDAIGIEVLPGALMRVNAPELNIRSGPGTQYNVISSASFGDVVSVINTEKGWSFIGSGWVKSNHIISADGN